MTFNKCFVFAALALLAAAGRAPGQVLKWTDDYPKAGSAKHSLQVKGLITPGANNTVGDLTVSVWAVSKNASIPTDFTIKETSFTNNGNGTYTFFQDNLSVGQGSTLYNVYLQIGLTTKLKANIPWRTQPVTGTSSAN